jgi:hypothetical protein
MRTEIALALALLALADTARAEPAAEPAPQAKPGTPDRLLYGARVFVRDTLSGIDAGGATTWREDRSLDSARGFVSYRPSKRLRMDLEVELAGDQVELKDTFIEYEPTGFLELKAGRFKRPVSFIGLESNWELPRIDRGLLSDLRVDDRRLLFAGGRGDGLALKAELPGAIRPELTVTVQESDLVDDLGLPITEAANQDLFGRAEVEPLPGLHLALAGGLVAGLHRRGDPDSVRHRPFGSLEAFLEQGALRAWLEVAGGLNASAYVNDVQVGRFAAARALVAPRLEGVPGLELLEPFAAAAWLEPSTLADDDQVGELTAGVALWLSRHLRLQLEGGRVVADDAAPTADATVIRMQLGTAFKAETELP